MPCFHPFPLVSGIKDKVEAILPVGDKIYVAVSGGIIQTWQSTGFAEEATNEPKVKLIATRKGLSRKPIDQLGYLAELDSLVILSDQSISIYDLPTLTTPLALPPSLRYIQTFSILNPSPSSASRTSLLLLGSRKKLYALAYSDGKPKGAIRELALPHTPRLILFPGSGSESGWKAHLHYNSADWAVLDVPEKTSGKGSELKVTDPPAAVEGSLPGSKVLTGSQAQAQGEGSNTGVTASASEKGGFGLGLGGYMGKGLGALAGAGRSSNTIVGVGIGSDADEKGLEEKSKGGETLVIRGDHGVYYTPSGQISRDTSIDWSSSTPDDLAFPPPFIIASLPGGKVEVRLAGSGAVQQLVTVGAGSGKVDVNAPVVGTTGAGSGSLIRLLGVHEPSLRATSPSNRPSPLFYLSTPNDKVQLQSEGSTIWALRGEGWKEMVEECVREGRFEDARGLLRGLPRNSGVDVRHYDNLLDKLQAVSAFSTEHWEPSIESFIRLNITPAKVVALYPASNISGRLHIPQEQWVPVFGGPEGGRLMPVEREKGAGEEKRGVAGVLRSVAHLGGGATKKDTASIRGREKESDAASIVQDEGDAHSVKEEPVEYKVLPPAALESLIHYLSDRRHKLTGAMSALSTPSIDSLPPFKSIPTSELLDYPDVPFSELSPEQLVRVAQIVYTALLKVYLAIRPVLVGSLCRIENWCEVEEVEELLREKKKFSDLVDLYQGKKMHDKALGLLRELAKDEDDKLDKLDPTIRYLQKMGPNHLNLILQQSDWLFKEDPKFALRVFTADEAEVEALPRHEVLRYLERTNEPACIGYLEHIINELGEAGPDFHDKLAELYLKSARKAPESDQEGERRLLGFLESSEQYRADRLLGRMQSEELPRVRAVLLGKLGNHDGALQIYVYRLKDCEGAEEYCSKVYQNNPDPKGIFLNLLRIYLRPSGTTAPLLDQALMLIGTHGTRIDALETIDLLPPLVTMEDVQKFFLRTLRDGHSKMNQARVTKGLLKARKEQVDRGLVRLQQKRVRITDLRICPQCHKRIGQSAIAVHAPRGEVTHYNCKDAYSRTLALHRA